VVATAAGGRNELVGVAVREAKLYMGDSQGEEAFRRVADARAKAVVE
jgi:hypothetical protein